MLHPFGPEIWISGGADVQVLGFHYPTRMVVIRLQDGGLFVCSPIPLSKALAAAVDALGVVKHIIAPNSLHHLSLPDWQMAYPEAKLYAPPKLRDKRKDIVFDVDLNETAPADWASQIDQVLVQGNRITTEVVFFHAESGTVLFTDLLQQFAPDWFSGWRKVIAKLDLMVEVEPSVPRKFRAAFTDRPAARTAIGKIFAWPATQVLIAHGTPVTRDAPAFLRRAFRWLKV